MPVVVAASSDSNLVAEDLIDEPILVDPSKSASGQVIDQGFGASAEAAGNDQPNPRKEWAEANLSPMGQNSTRGLWCGSRSNRRRPDDEFAAAGRSVPVASDPDRSAHDHDSGLA
jgi:hypothetical protein